MERSGTLIETEVDIRQALLSSLKGQPPIPAAIPAALPQASPAPVPAAAPQPAAGRSASPYRPTARPPVPILVVFDDRRTEGGVYRLLGLRFVIGRTEGDLRLPLSPQGAESTQIAPED